MAVDSIRGAPVLPVRPGRPTAAIATAGAGLCIVIGLLVTGWSTSQYDWLDGLARAVMVGAPIAVGLYAYGRRPFARFGVLLMGVGVAWFVVSLSSSTNDVIYSVGRVCAWFAEIAIVFFGAGVPERAARRTLGPLPCRRSHRDRVRALRAYGAAGRGLSVADAVDGLRLRLPFQCIRRPRRTADGTLGRRSLPT